MHLVLLLIRLPLFACREHLHAAELKAIEDQENAKKRFRDWVKTKVPDAEYMNICSGPQVMLFACQACSVHPLKEAAGSAKPHAGVSAPMP